MNQSEYFNWSISILLSLLLYGAIFLQRGAHMGVESATIMPSPLITRLSFNQAKIPDAVPDTLPVIKKPRPERIKKLKPKPVVAKKAPPIKKIEKIEPVKKMASQPQTQGQQVSISSDTLLQQKREQYLQKLLKHIESFKFYPRAARKRYIEGNVKISFLLRDDGSYEQLILDGERSILVSATRTALEAATPLPIPADDLELSRQIEFTMVYSLIQ
jgi:protein TonB